jgi:hypothetical protein
MADSKKKNINIERRTGTGKKRGMNRSADAGVGPVRRSGPGEAVMELWRRQTWIRVPHWRTVPLPSDRGGMQGKRIVMFF